MVYRSPFLYLLLAILLPAVLSLLGSYATGGAFIFMSPALAWGLIFFCAVFFALERWVVQRLLRSPVALDVAFNRVVLNGRETPFQFSEAGSVLADAAALGDAIELALLRDPARLKLRPAAEVRVLVGDKALTVLERSALERVLAERFLCHRVVECPSA